MVKIEQKDNCPLIGMKPCAKLDCVFFTKLQGLHPQTKEPVDEWDCTFKWLTLLLIEGSRESRETAAAVESFRNEMVKQGNVVLGLASDERVKRLM